MLHGHVLNVHFNASKLNPALPSAAALHGIKRGRARLQRHHMRDECSPWWDTQPTWASATCSSPKYHSKDWLPSACTSSTEESSKARILGMLETPVFQSILGFKEEGNLPALLFQLSIPSTPFFLFSLPHFSFPSQLHHAPFQPGTDPKLPTLPSSPSPSSPISNAQFLLS